MPSEKAIRILRSKSDLSDDEIESMSDAAAWKLIYDLDPPKAKGIQICFTGFPPSEKKRLTQAAESNGLEVVKSVTKQLHYLCIGSNAGPSKIQKAEEQGVVLLTKEQLLSLFETGELPHNV